MTRATRAPRHRALVGISGYVYPRWRGTFYPAEIPTRRWLEYASRTFPSIELNGTFYSLKSPAIFAKWAAEVPEGFVFAVKGSRYITHNLKLRNARQALANFFASGVLALGAATGPFLWQLPATYGFDRDKVETFLRLLPRDSRAAARLARDHDDRIRDPLTRARDTIAYRHVFEPRHETFFGDEFYGLLREYDCGFVIADTAGKFPYAEEVTTDLVYIRLHGSTQLYVSGYTDAELDAWAAKIRAWLRR
ncbi:MAG TPA: DUF72 domain-containing protein, partial [Gemmatimonadaceae bacterium]|nr:DUF72 domain-containing protein [Gemmatimonadaceae bacterium]